MLAKPATVAAAVAVVIHAPAVADQSLSISQLASSMSLFLISRSMVREGVSPFLAFTQVTTRHRQFSVVLGAVGRTITIFA